MELWESLISEGIINRLGWTLVHFVWQAAAVALILSISLKLLRKSSANLRYIVSCAALMAVAILPVVTLSLVPVTEKPIDSIEPAANVQTPVNRESVEMEIGITAKKRSTQNTSVMEVSTENSTSRENAAVSKRVSLPEQISGYLEPKLPYLVAGWLVGVFGLSLWYLGGWTQLQRMRRRMVKPVNERVRGKLKSVADIIGVNRAVEVVESAFVVSPTVVGWIKPVILLPASVLTGFSSEQIEAILAHELAHIKRCDYLVNMLQACTEILGFYHPAVWWISKKIRAERENCCDDIAVKVTGDKIGYAKTLALFEGIRADKPELAVAASGSSLFQRICRLIQKEPEGVRIDWKPSIIAILLIIALLIPTGFALTSNSKAIESNSIESISPKQLITAIAESERKIRDIQLHMVCKVIEDDWLFYYYDWGYDSGKEYLSGTSYSKDRLGQTTSQKILRSFDGKLYYSLYRNPEGVKPQTYGSIDKKDIGFGGFLTFNMLLGYSTYGYQRASLSELMAKADSVIIKDKLETVDGHKCYVVDVVNSNFNDSPGKIYNTRLWIDMNRDYRVLKHEQYFDNNKPEEYFKKLKWRIDKIKLVNIDSVWLPVQGEREFHNFGIKSRRLIIDTDSIRLNKSIPEDKFRIDFPKGCEVYNNVTKTRYTVGQPSEAESEYDDRHWIDWAGELSLDELIGVLRETEKLSGVDLNKVLAVVNELVTTGESAVPELGKELAATESARMQSFIALILRGIGDPEAVPYLIQGLERSLTNSDLGFGSLNQESILKQAYQQWQLKPDSTSLGLGRPVREITVALEKLTGHSESHDHWHAYDSNGNRLGSYIVTPEIIDRQKAHKKQVAESWRNWWQSNKNKVLAEYSAGQLPKEAVAPSPKAQPKHANDAEDVKGVLAAPQGAELHFAIVPNIGIDRQPSLTKQKYQKYVDDLMENGPAKGSLSGDSFQWSRINENCPGIDTLPVQTYKNEKYVLLCARQDYVLRPTFEGKQIWSLKNAEAVKGAMGKPAVNVKFDGAGCMLFHEFTKRNIENRMAIEAAWSGLGVISAPVIEKPIEMRTTISGSFTEQQAKGLAELLKKGITENADQNLDKAEAAEVIGKLFRAFESFDIEAMKEVLVGDHQKAFDMIEAEGKKGWPEFEIDEDPIVINITKTDDGKYRVLVLVSRKDYSYNQAFHLVAADDGFKVDYDLGAHLDDIREIRTMSAAEFGKKQLEEKISLWKNADNKQLIKLKDESIQKLHDMILAAEYAAKHKIKVLHSSENELKVEIEKLEKMTPEQFRDYILKEFETLTNKF